MNTATLMPSDRTLALLAIATAVAATIAGLAVVDTPSKTRAIRIDSSRLSDLHALATAVERYYEDKSTLPDALSDVESSRGRVDPQTGAPYGYSILGPRRFKLCATFALDNTKQEDRWIRGWRGGPAIRRHPKGHHCFDYRIPRAKD